MPEMKRPGGPPAFITPPTSAPIRTATPDPGRVRDGRSGTATSAAPPRPRAGGLPCLRAGPRLRWSVSTPGPPPSTAMPGPIAARSPLPPPGPDRRAMPPSGAGSPPARRQHLACAAASETPLRAPANRFWPQQPRTIEEAGLTVSMVEELILKAIFFAGEMRGMDLANRLKLPSTIIDEVIEGLRRQKYIDIRGGGGAGVGKTTMIYQLTSFATELMRQILDRNRYNGPAPVSLQEWVAAVKRQTVRGNRITRAKMEDKFDGSHHPRLHLRRHRPGDELRARHLLLRPAGQRQDGHLSAHGGLLRGGHLHPPRHHDRRLHRPHLRQHPPQAHRGGAR